MTTESGYQCTVCQCEFTSDEGGIRGYFGILPVTFCVTCYTCMVDMIDQDSGTPVGAEE